MKSRSVGERIENFMVTWLKSELMLNELNMGTNREADIVGSLMNLSTRWTLGTAMLEEQRFGDCSFLYVSFFYSILMGQISS